MNPYRAPARGGKVGTNGPTRTKRRLPIGGALLGLLFVLSSNASTARADDAEDRRIADRLSAMLRAGRTVISESQGLINDPAIAEKGLSGDAVLARAVKAFRDQTGIDPYAIDATSREGRLLGAEMAAIRTVMDANQASLNVPGKGFKGFIPAIFGRLVAEEFSRRTDGLAVMKVTAPAPLVRNRKSKPDAWEAQVITSRFLAADWPKGQPYEQLVEQGGDRVFRIGVPEYYAASCLACHGGPKGALDITGYPKEGADLGDLGGVISIRLVRK